MISNQDVIHLAKLSRLRFDETEVSQYTKDLASIFEYAKTLNDLPTDDIAPSAHAIPIENVFREDIITTFNADSLLKNAPAEEGHAFKVPKILVD
jgi:aspartyl-tRNA(Asn)/glutamyl-tRNA(Gln) amidotransferase subunit C